MKRIISVLLSLVYILIVSIFFYLFFIGFNWKDSLVEQKHSLPTPTVTIEGSGVYGVDIHNTIVITTND